MLATALPIESYALELLPQPGVLSVHSFVGVEELDRPYRFEVVFTSVVRDLAMGSVLGRPGRFVIAPTGMDGVGEPRVWNGLVTRFETLGSSRDETRYRAVLEPRVSDLALEITSRLFQHQSVPQIIEAVLRRAGLTAADFRFDLRGRYPPREYTTQYQESTLAFIGRLAADEGIWFRFENTPEREVIVFGDDLDAYVRPALSVPYREDAGLESGGAQAVKTLHESCARTPGSVRVDTNLNNTRNIVRTAARNELRMEDRRGEEHVHLASPYAVSELNLGSLADDAFKARGEGAELRSDKPVVVRSNQGVLLTAEGQPGAGGQQQDMAQTQRHLQAAHGVLEGLSEAARAATAHLAQIEAHQAFLEGQLATLERQVLIASAPEGLALTSGEHMALHADRNLTQVAGGALDMAAGESVTIAAAEAVSLLAASGGAQLIAAGGRVEVEAQDDAMQIAALKELTIASTSEKVVITAAKEIWIGAGGSYIKINQCHIELGSPGEVFVKTTELDVTGPVSEMLPLPVFIREAYDGGFTLIDEETGEAIANREYRIKREDGSYEHGVTDENGRTHIVNTLESEKLVFEVKD